ncbi:MAG: TlpA disulfide reductase family protein [Flavobacteriaceae bacterium]|nr:TlpA disulfide reductase family protein [Flavobacteriaceae bacterium]MDG2313963.1 TlpA disulfide reductase family protein [Flavobacteriaceae bacterium]
MKKYFVYFLLITVFTQCSQSTAYKVDGTVDMDDASQIFLIKVGEDSRPQPLDTLEVMDGKFSFSGEIDIPEMHYLFFDGQRGNLPFVLESGNITISAYKDSLRSSKVSGTASNKDFAAYLKGAKKFGEDLSKIQMEMRNPAISGDSLAISDLKEQFDAMIDKLTQYELDFVTNESDSYISSLILERMLMNKSIEFEEAAALYASFSDLVKKTKSAQNINNILNPEANEPETPKKLGVGSIAPDFSAPNPAGQQVSLKQVASSGKITVIDFWASWCKPCRVENPAIVAMYEKFSHKGLTIIGVSLDKDANKWKEAIEDDHLTWSQVSNLKYWQDPIARLYDVNSIPRTFIVDQNLTILSSGLRGAQLEEKVEELLAL